MPLVLNSPNDSTAAAREAGLRFTRDGQPGIRRERRGRGFRYVGPDGAPIRDEQTLTRIRSLAIPPAWTDVWICPRENGHLQATGRDARGRKQHRYHPRWRASRDETKFGRVVAFGLALPRLRAAVQADLARPGLPREKVLATVVRLMEATLIRVGNEEYARANGSFGLTTLRNRHVAVAGEELRFRFRGKSGVTHAIDLRDRRLARIVRRCRDLPGQLLFQYLDEDGTTRAIDSADVNEYLRRAAGEEFTAKDIRTWSATMLTAQALLELGPCETEAEARRYALATIAVVARRLGNTANVCRKCYVHPAVVEAYLDGSLPRELTGPDEEGVLAFLRRRLERPPRQAC
jgi:DNA topoisomerase-1